MGINVTAPQTGGLVSIGIYAVNASLDAAGAPIGTVYDLSTSGAGGVSKSATFTGPLVANVK